MPLITFSWEKFSGSSIERKPASRMLWLRRIGNQSCRDDLMPVNGCWDACKITKGTRYLTAERHRSVR